MNFIKHLLFPHGFAGVLLTAFLGLFASIAVAQNEGPGANYRLQPQDHVTVRVYGEPDLETSQRIDGRGNISMPLLGDIELAGRSVRQAEAYIEQQFREQKFLVNPQVTVVVVDYAPRQFFVFGQVKSPGTKPFPFESKSIDIIRAISMAGDFTDIANTSSVRITRKHSDGSESTLIWNLDGVIAGKNREDGVRSQYRIFPGDVIFVPERIF